MTLPLTRNETATAAAPVKSSTVNALQDCIIGRKHGLITVPLPVGQFRLGASGFVGVLPYIGSSVGGYGVSFNPSTQKICGYLDCPLPFGTVITAVRVSLTDIAAAAAVKVALRGSDGVGGSTENATTAFSAGSGAQQVVALALAAPHVVGVTTPGIPFVALTTAVNATGAYDVYEVEVDCYKP